MSPFDDRLRETVATMIRVAPSPRPFEELDISADAATLVVPARRHRGLVAAAVAIVVVGAIALGAVLIRPDQAARSSEAAHRPPVEVASLGSARADVEVFMTVGATAAQHDGVRRSIARNPLVRKYAFVSNLGAFEEFKRLFRDQPDLVATVSPSSLPTSFRILVAQGASRNAIAAGLQRLDGVDDVKTNVGCRKLAKILHRPPNEGC